MLNRLSHESFYYVSNPTLLVHPISDNKIALEISSKDIEKLGADGADIMWTQPDNRYIDIYFGEYSPLIFIRPDEDESYEVATLEEFKDAYPLELRVDTITFHLKQSNIGKAKATFNALWCTMI